MVSDEYLYRYDGICYSAGTDEWGDPLPYKGRREIYCQEYSIIKRTPCGAWINTWAGQHKFVNLNANKRYACLSKEDALTSFIARKKRQIKILSSRIDDAKAFLEKALNAKS